MRTKSDIILYCKTIGGGRIEKDRTLRKDVEKTEERVRQKKAKHLERI